MTLAFSFGRRERAAAPAFHISEFLILSSSFLSLGTGFKYFLAKGFGGRVFLDYYRRSETYAFENDDSSTKVVQGPRIQFGLSYRW